MLHLNAFKISDSLESLSKINFNRYYNILCMIFTAVNIEAFYNDVIKQKWQFIFHH